MKEISQLNPIEAVQPESEDFLRLLIDNVRDYAIFMLDPEGRIVTWNVAAENIKGYKPHEAIGQHFSIFYPEEDIKRGKPEYELKVAAKEGRFEDEGWRLRKDGSRFWANVVITALRDKDGTLRGFGKVTRNLTERKLAEEQRLQLVREHAARAEAESDNRRKDEFLAMVSHELRTPLNAVLGWARMLRSGKLDQETTSRALEAIERNAQVQTQLIEDLLDISRLISGKLRLNVSGLDPSAVVESAIDSIRPAADAKEINLQIVLDPSAGLVFGDANRLQQVVWNLLTNAIKFTPKRGRVLVRLLRVNSDVEIAVSDNGKGIPPDFLPYVFDRFTQCDSGITRAQGGLGLGLAIVRQLVELHGGSVKVESGGENQGSTFTVLLPVMISRASGGLGPAAGQAEAYSPVFECPAVLQGRQMLVVDDERDARTLLASILEQCQVKVTAAASCAEAIQVLDRLRPDIIVSDIGMPGEEGYSLIRRVRERENELHIKRVPAIALTAHARLEDRVRALSAGYQSHVAKPVDPVELVAVVASLLEGTGRK